MILIKKAEYIKDYRIQLTFNNGLTGEVDLSELVNWDKRRIFTELKDINKFKDFIVSFDTICWSNGLDLAPEYLYFLAFKSDVKLKKQFEEWGYVQNQTLTNA